MRWNPARGNKNAGTKARGHGADNALRIPGFGRSSVRYYERLDSFATLVRQVGGCEIRFFIEPARSNYFHPCTVDDVCALLSHCPEADLKAFNFVVMRQPTRKQRILCPVWGRAVFHFSVQAYGGAAIILEAQTLAPYRWSLSMGPDRDRELERLIQDGHDVRRGKRGYEIHPTAASLRATMLYRTLVHELGHHVDFKRFTADEWAGRTPKDKEDFAHRYASETATALRRIEVLPFDPVINLETLGQDGLQPSWFCAA